MAEKEYIERGALIRHLNDEMKECGDACENFRPIAYGTILGLRGAISFANTLPAADVVKVVRCKDCKHSQFVCENSCFCRHTNTPWFNNLFEVYMNADDFCSYGERKE